METETDVTMTQQERTESAGGTSALILLAEEREAVACLLSQSNTASGQRSSVTSVYRSRRRETLASGTDPFTNYDIAAHAVINIAVSRTLPESFSERIDSGSFSVVAAGGFSQFRTVAMSPIGDVVSPRLVEFVRYVPGEKETATSDLFLMRGGLYYDEPQLTPKNQRGNRVYSIDGDGATEGGFEQMLGRTPIGFVGQV
jgi:hypothetical protein